MRKIPARRVAGSPKTCLCHTESGLSATAFPNPAESVIAAADHGLFSADRTYLEIGGGNLRNAAYVQAKFHPKECVVVEQRSVTERFGEAYRKFSRGGGTVQHDLPGRRYDTIVMTYVLETICPPSTRHSLLEQVATLMHRDSALVISARGFGGVRGTSYKRCEHSDGFRSARGAFVRGYSVPDVIALFGEYGLSFFPLKRYRTDTPENIHGIGKVRNDR